MSNYREMDVREAQNRRDYYLENPNAETAAFNRDPQKFMEQTALMELALKKQREIDFKNRYYGGQ